MNKLADKIYKLLDDEIAFLENQIKLIQNSGISTEEADLKHLGGRLYQLNIIKYRFKEFL